jgi:uncharacterized protein HemY
VSAYQQALRQAEAASRAMPNNPIFVNTRGLACYRVGKFEEAVEALTQSATLRKGPNAHDLAFLAMAQQKLGQVEQAQATLIRLRGMMQQREWATKPDAQRFLREAEDLLKTPLANGI